MPIIEEIGQMKKQGLKEDEIARRLREKGISPKEISEALDQNKVKTAISPNEMEPSLMAEPINNLPMPTPGEKTEQQFYPEMTPPPPTYSQQINEEMQFAQPSTQEMPGYYSEEAYPQYQEEYSQPLDTEIITDIAEQIVDEKTAKLQKHLSEILRFKIETQGKMSNIDDRLRRIEMMIDKLQTSILGEIGDYGQDIADLKEEMQATQNSFSKILNPLSENIEELRKITGSSSKTPKTTKTKTTTKTTNKKTKTKDGFENYLRG